MPSVFCLVFWANSSYKEDKIASLGKKKKNLPHIEGCHFSRRFTSQGASTEKIIRFVIIF
jgi:hypothetical protein